MITGIKKTHKTTEIYFDEADKWTTVITYNTQALKTDSLHSRKNIRSCAK